MASNTDVVKKNYTITCLYYVSISVSVCLSPAFIKTRSSNFPELLIYARGSFHGKSSRAVGHRICGPSRIIQLLRQECYTE